MMNDLSVVFAIPMGIFLTWLVTFGADSIRERLFPTQDVSDEPVEFQAHLYTEKQALYSKEFWEDILWSYCDLSLKSDFRCEIEDDSVIKVVLWVERKVTIFFHIGPLDAADCLTIKTTMNKIGRNEYRIKTPEDIVKKARTVRRALQH